MGRGDDLQEMLTTYIDSWKEEELENRCWTRCIPGRIAVLNNKEQGDFFRTDLQNALGKDESYNVQIQPNRQSKSGGPNSSRSRVVALAGRRSHACVLIHKDAEPKAMAVRDAFKSSCSKNQKRVQGKGDLYMKVFIYQDGGWRNEETKNSKDGTEYEPVVEWRDPFDELPENLKWRESKDATWWNEFFAWQASTMKKQKTNSLTKEDRDDWQRRMNEYYQEASTSQC